MTPRRTELLFGAFFLAIVALIALMFGLYPTIEIPPDAAVRTIGKLVGTVSGVACIVTVVRALFGR
jgi:hypothetical protein